MTDRERTQEAEANYFAICLLMPRQWVHTELDKLLDLNKNMPEDEIVQRMAKRFQVSEVMMTMRLVELGRMIAP